MIFSLARLSAVVNMKVKDYRRNGATGWFDLLKKGGQARKVPAHHQASIYTTEYLGAASIREQKNSPLFRSAGPGRSMAGNSPSARSCATTCWPSPSATHAAPGCPRI